MRHIPGIGTRTGDGSGVYDGVRITLTGRVNASNDGTFSGSLDGSMARIS